jgi:hypothetical protein
MLENKSDPPDFALPAIDAVARLARAYGAVCRANGMLDALDDDIDRWLGALIRIEWGPEALEAAYKARYAQRFHASPCAADGVEETPHRRTWNTKAGGKGPHERR